MNENSEVVYLDTIKDEPKTAEANRVVEHPEEAVSYGQFNVENGRPKMKFITRKYREHVELPFFKACNIIIREM
ncbi:hypothetical protein RB195_020729 [Necator americanus]|uniref:Uncharacterized protein n=1 Tax=Necator americanus TaxID=51031 RepID=A0ABR1CMF2_NECAM